MTEYPEMVDGKPDELIPRRSYDTAYRIANTNRRYDRLHWLNAHPHHFWLRYVNDCRLIQLVWSEKRARIMMEVNNHRMNVHSCSPVTVTCHLAQ